MRKLLLSLILIPQLAFGSYIQIPSTGAGITSLNGQTGATQTFANGTTGTTPAFSSSGNTHTLNIPNSSAAGVTQGGLSKADYDIFNAKVSGPGSATDNAMCLFNGTTGAIIKNSTLTYDGSSFSKTTDGAYTLGTMTAGVGAGRVTKGFASQQWVAGNLGTHALSPSVLFATTQGVFGVGNNNAGMGSDTYGTGLQGEFGHWHARGTNTAPTALLQNDSLGVFTASGFNGTTWQVESARRNFQIQAIADENFSVTNMGTRVNLSKIKLGSIVPVVHTQWDGTGNFNLINGTNSIVSSFTNASTTNVATSYIRGNASSPQYYASSNTTRPAFAGEGYGATGATVPQSVLRKARGTNTAPTAVLSGDFLGVHFLGGHDGTIFTDGAQINGNASENWSVTNHGTNLALANTKDGAGEVQTVRYYMGGDGNHHFVTGNILSETDGLVNIGAETANRVGYFYSKKGANVGSSGLIPVNASAPFNDGLLQVGSEGAGAFPSSIVELGSAGASGDNPAHLSFVYTPDGVDLFSSNLSMNEATYNMTYTTSGTAFDFHSNVVLAEAGNGLQVKEGSNARLGRATLVAGTVTVANTSVTASTEIFVTCQDPNGGVPGAAYISARTPGVSFDITSTSVADTCIEAWHLVEPAP